MKFITVNKSSNSKKTLNPKIVWIALLLLLPILVLYSIASGNMDISFTEAITSINNHLGINIFTRNIEATKDYTIWNIRLPRVILALAIGMALSLAGAILQGILANPLADTGVIGVSSGSAVGACLAIYLGGLHASFSNFFSNSWIQILFAFMFGIITVIFVLLTSIRTMFNSAVIMILTGIAINAFCGGIISYLTSSGSNISREQMIFWQMGSLSQANWDYVKIILAICLISSLICIGMGRKIDILSLGDHQASQLGLHVTRFRSLSLIIVAFLTAGAVAFSGLILFIGLIVPHIMRFIVGAKNRILLPISAMAGAIFLLVADTICRTAIPNTELPIGMLTSLIGGPIFLILVIKLTKRA